MPTLDVAAPAEAQAPADDGAALSVSASADVELGAAPEVEVDLAGTCGLSRAHQVSVSAEERATISIRQGIVGDRALVLSSFRTTLKQAHSPYTEGVPSKLLVAKFEELLNAPDWRQLVACLETEPNEVLGWFLFRPATVMQVRRKRLPVPQAAAWICVKPEWQRIGVAKALFLAAKLAPSSILCAFDWPAFSGNVYARTHFIFAPYLPDVAAWDRLKLEGKL